MPKKRQLVITRSSRATGGSPGELASMGPVAHVLSSLALYNTAPDGSRRNTGMEVLWGPGMVLEIPAGVDEVSQVLATITDDDIALPVLMRACKALGWAMTDVETGRSFG